MSEKKKYLQIHTVFVHAEFKATDNPETDLITEFILCPFTFQVVKLCSE